MTETERTIIYYAIRVVQTYHDSGGDDIDGTRALNELIDWANELAQEQGVNLAYLHDRYTLPPDDGVRP